MAIESVLAQSFGELELIVVDDGSTDGTVDVVQHYARRDNRIVHVRYEQNCGFPAPRMNAGMVIARGTHVGFVFDDGCLYQHALEKLYDACQKRPNTVCYGFCNEYRGASVVTWGFAFSETLLRHKNLIPNNAVLFPRTIAETCGGYDHNVLLKRVNDWDLWRRYARHASFHRIPDIVAEEHGPNQTDSLENAVTMHHDMAARLIRVNRGDKLALSRLSERNIYGLEDFGEAVTAEDLMRAFGLFAEHARAVKDEEAAEFFASKRHEIVSRIESHQSVGKLPVRTLRVCHLRCGSEEELAEPNKAEDVLSQLVDRGKLECRRVAQQGAHYFVDGRDWLSFDVCVFDSPVDTMGLALMEGLRQFGRPAILNVEDASTLSSGSADLLEAAENSAVVILHSAELKQDLIRLIGFDRVRMVPPEPDSWLDLLRGCADGSTRKRNPAEFAGGSRGAVGPNRYAAQRKETVRVGDFVHLRAREFNAHADHRNELRALNYALEINPGHIPAALDRAGLLRKATKYDVALEKLEPTLALHPENHEIVSCAMELALELKDWHRAARIFATYLTATLECQDTSSQAGTEERVHRAPETIDLSADKGHDAILKAICAHPTRPEPYVAYGDYFFHTNDFDGAARAYFAALNLEPSTLEPLNVTIRQRIERANELWRKQGEHRVCRDPEFSVLINTYNRAGWLRKCLAAYCIQTFSPDRFEIVIVDDGSEDDTRAVVESFEPYLNIRYVRQAHAGMATARTLLVKSAGSPLLGFFDDDDIVAPTCVEEHWKAHQEHPEPDVAVLGYSEWSPDVSVSPLMHYVTDVGRHYVDYPSLRHGQFYDFRCFWGGRSSCKKALLDGSDLFDPQFTFGYEDIELMYRLSKRRPVRVLFNRNALHRFMQPMNLDAFLRRTERQGRTAYFFLGKHPDPALKQYLPIDHAMSQWADLEPIYDKLVSLARKLEQVVDEITPESLNTDACKELFAVYGKLHDAAWAKGVVAGQLEKLEPEIEKARANQTGPRILILDEILAVPDRTAGALRMHHIVELLLSLGCRISYGAYLARGFDEHSERLNRLGVRTVYLGGACASSTFSGAKEVARAQKAIDDLAAFAESYDIVWICFHWLARIYLPLIRARYPKAKVFVDSIDLHYIREARAARLAHDRKKTMSAYATRVMELTAYACADVVGVVTAVEKERLTLDVPRARAFVLPTVHDPVPDTPGPQGRRGLVFVGGFHHEPNVDAVIWFVKEVYPLIAKRQPETDVYVIGQEPPANVKTLASQHIHVLGWVPDTAPYLNSALVSIAPLRYGAGMKGKIGEALAYGVPVVTTSVGAEGIGIVNGVHALVADTAEEFAQAVCRLIEDEPLWNRLSAAGKELLERRWGSNRMRKRLETVVFELLTAEKAPRVSGDEAEQNPEHAPAYKEALRAAESGNLNRAIELMSAHLKDRPDHAGGWNDLGVLYHHDGRVADAQNCFERALAIPGGWKTLACENLVETFIASGKRDEANRLASRWTDESPEMPEPWLLWARLKSEQGDFTEAKRAIERVLSLDPSNEIAREYLAQIDLTTKTS